MELIELHNLQSVLDEYAAQAAELYKYQISLGGKNASRKLIDSVSCVVRTSGSLYEVVMNLEHYWKYVEGGSKGTVSSPMGAKYPAHRPPAWAIEKWINVKLILPRPDQYGRIPSPKKLSYAIAANIEKYGVEPFPAMATTIEELNKMFEGKFVKAFTEDAERLIGKFINLADNKMFKF